MKIKNIFLELLYDGPRLTITFAKGENKAVARLYEAIGGIDPEKDYDVTVKRKRRKRSLDANAYLWVLIGKLGEAMTLPNTEVYRQYIGEMHTYTIVPIKADEVEEWQEMWNRGHLGWLCEDMGPCRNLPGHHYMKCYRGSSTFNQKEMSQLIDMVVQDCKEQGVETATPNELERMKQEWGVADG